MKQMNVPAFSAPQIGYKLYNRFRGVDYSTDESMIDDSRSPLALNMISDEGGSPAKRLGWRTLHTFEDGGRVNGIFPFRDKAGKEETIVHQKETLYRITTDKDGKITQETLLAGVGDAISRGFYQLGKLYILTGTAYLVYDGTAAARVRDKAYTPITSITRAPTGGGKAYEDVNLLSGWRKNSFAGDGSSTTFVLDVKELSTKHSVSAWINGGDETKSGFTVNFAAGTVQFNGAPARDPNGTDNVTIKFYKQPDGNGALIEGCTVFGMFGYGSDNRVFLSGNRSELCREWYSGLSDPTYFPSRNYINVGNYAPIVQYLKYQGELLVIKQDNRQEATIWHHTAEMKDDGAIFPLREGVFGVGGIAGGAACTLLDDPLFLSPYGVYAPVNTFAGSMFQRGLQARSKRINPRLTREPRLDAAIAVCWKSYYILCVDAHCYIADANQDKANGGYEWYYWDNIPACCFAANMDDLYFGTQDGRLCRFNNDIVGEDGTVLMRAYNDDGAPIRWEWRSKLDSLEYPTRYKTLKKAGNAVQLTAFTRSSCDVLLRTERDFGTLKAQPVVDIMDFNDTDFERFTFSTLKNQTIPYKAKVKKFLYLQIIMRGESMDEGAGVLSAALRYSLGGYAKKRKL